MLSTDSSPPVNEDTLEKIVISSLENPSGLDAHEDPAMVKRAWQKLDRHVLPLAAMFFFLSFLDRTNVGNARVAGLQTDLRMSNHQYSIALTVTYVPYVMFELPSNLMLKAVGPNLLLPTILTLWGIVCALQGVVNSYAGLLVCRFFLGFFEAGIIPGLVLYLSYFYPRYKMNIRVATIFSASSLSGAFSGILAYGIIQMDGVGNRPGWSWIFILEGLFTFLFGFSSYFICPRSVDEVWFLSTEEKKYVKGRLLEEHAHKDEEGFSWKEVIEALKLPHLWFMCIVMFCSATILFGFAYFSPSIILGLGYTAADAQLMSVPPYAVGCIMTLTASFISDRYRCRGIICIIATLFCGIGFAIFLGSKSTAAQYGSLFFSISGAGMGGPTQATWVSNNASPQTRRATMIAMAFTLSNSGGILATWLLGSLSPAPRYTEATITLLVLSLIAALICGLNMIYLQTQNIKKAEQRKTMIREDEEPGLGNRSAWYIYSL
ncbi:major facilitator superfamily domain-containing protein [Lentinula aciculospora]|uniref:Major facilitator superfamily domain-containing protein n=1 Tax=Lentinula aciculospora TaxID=153920 RepID=A0A9W9AEX3_9AGAR|nr:major facilitator superfamily domain-containing protein [Lentinula aciculospora]